LAADTIYAPATAPGRAPVGVLRVSGPHAAAVARALAGERLPEPRVAALRRLRDPRSGEPIDQALLLWFPAPRSETGEDLLEIQHHGGAAVQGMLLAALEGVAGCRPAGPGEFTRQAFLNGKLDLTAAEGLADLIDATTRAQARQALRQLEGGLGRLYGGWRERLLDALARIEAEIDFAAEEEVPEALLAPLLPDLARLRAEIAAHLADAGRGERLRAGVTVAVIGAPNVGKSSLVNLLARREVAIVTAIPGTTRDVIEVQLDLDGVLVTLLDTAGLRPTADPIEAEGVARARQRAAQAELRLRVVEPDGPFDPARTDDTILVVNKIDTAPGVALPDGAVAISCRTGAGIAGLTRAVALRAADLVAAGEGPPLTRARHRTAVAAAEAALGRVATLAAGGGELALVAEDLRLAARAVGGITGAVGVEDVLDRIFATFCIGK
jgi:tRNA modification GTPase